MAAVGLWFDYAHGHEPYSEWRTQSGLSCCNQNDCAPATIWEDADGNLKARQNGIEYFVPRQSVLAIPSPDGRSHLCVYQGRPICAVIGEVRS